MFHGYVLVGNASVGDLHCISILNKLPSQAHPKYGTILASASYDSRVFIWRQSPLTSNAPQSSTWQRVFDYTLHTASVNAISWSPSELGCLLACASSDGNVSVLEFTEGRWDHVMFPAHGAGVNSVSWAPMWGGGGQSVQGGGKRRFVTGGSDCALKIWEWDPQSSTYSTTHTLLGHSDWVRDVAWCPTILSRAYIASASQDKTVRIWTSDPASDYREWKEAAVLDFESVCWRCSWSLAGNVLAVGGGDNKVSLWKEALKGRWEKVKTIEE